MPNRGADPRASQEPQGACTMRLREAQSGPAPCSGARRQNKVLDEVSAAILGGVAAENGLFSGRGFLRSAERAMLGWMNGKSFLNFSGNKIQIAQYLFKSPPFLGASFGILII